MNGASQSVVERALWWSYGLTYDGLRHFWPYQDLVRRVVQRCEQEVPRAGSVLELGCGTGNVLQALDEQLPSASLTGVDASSTMCRRARRKVPKAAVVQADALDFLRGCDDDSYSLVVMQNSLYAMSDRELLWQELLRILTPDGAAVITNSDKAGSASLIREHRDNASDLALLRPTLLLVALVDALISQMSRSGTFHFIEADALRHEVAQAGGTLEEVERCYGDVNVLFTVRPAPARV